MSGLEFAASLVDSLAWPLVALFSVWLLREPLSRLLSGPVRRWKAGPSGLEIEYWNRTVASTREGLLRDRKGKETAGLRAASRVAVSEELSNLAVASPTSAISEAFERIERELRVMLIDQQHEAPAQLDAAGLALLAEEKGLINRETAKAVEGLLVLRNLAAHGQAGELTPTRAGEYLTLADAVLFTLRQEPSS